MAESNGKREGQEFKISWLALGKSLVSETCLREEQFWILRPVLLENEADTRAAETAAELAWRSSFHFGVTEPQQWDLVFWNGHFLKFNVYECLPHACMHMYHMGVWFLKRQEDDIESPEPRITDVD